MVFIRLKKECGDRETANGRRETAIVKGDVAKLRNGGEAVFALALGLKLAVILLSAFRFSCIGLQLEACSCIHANVCQN